MMLCSWTHCNQEQAAGDWMALYPPTLVVLPLSSFIQGPDARQSGQAGTEGLAVGSGMGGRGARPATPEPALEYTDASGKLKFNKRPAGSSAGAGEPGKGDKKKKAKRAKLAKLSNAKLLSFGDDEDG